MKIQNHSKFDKFVSKLAYLIYYNENVTGKTEEKFFGKYDIAILTFIGILLTTTILLLALRFVAQPAYWYLVDLFSIILLVSLEYFFVIRKLFQKNNGQSCSYVDY